jgi:sarcosine oxidase subunit beta
MMANHAYYTHAVNLGAHFRFSEPVTNFTIHQGQIQNVITPQGAYSSDYVINTAGADAAAIGNMAGIKIPVRPDSHEAAITEPVARFLGPMVVDIRPAEGNNINETSSFLPMVSRRMIEIMPRLKNIRVRRTWRGLYPMTPDGFPIIGKVSEIDNFLLGVGLCGQGFMLGPSGGELLTRLVVDKTTPEDSETLKILSPDRVFAGEEKLK